MLNSKGLDIDKVSYTVIDSSNIHPSSAAKDAELFESYSSDPYVRDLHESLSIDDNEDVSFLRAEPVRKLLYLRAWMFKNVYFAPKNRAREAFFEREVKRLWDDGKLSLEKMLDMNDYDFERFIKNNVKKKLHSEFFRMFPDKFEEYDRFENAKLEDVEKAYNYKFSRGKNLLVKKQPKFNPGTDTLVSVGSRKSVPFREVFPEDAKKIEEIAGSCEYVGLYRLFIK